VGGRGGERGAAPRVGVRGLGLYAARAFKFEDFLGRYDGQVVGTYASRAAALASPQCASRVRHGADKLITRRPSNGPGVELVDGATSGPPFLPRMNDPTRGGTRLQPNVELTPGGWVKVTQRRVPAFDLAAATSRPTSAPSYASRTATSTGTSSRASGAAPSTRWRWIRRINVSIVRG
jgi:hypothetical protein